MQQAQIRHFRDGVFSVGTNTPASLTQMYSTMASKGMHADLIVPQSTVISADELVAGLQKYPGLESIEPPNEWDIHGGPNWASTLMAEEPAILQAGREMHVPVLGPSLTQPASFIALGSLAQYMDFNNLHMYSGGRNPENGGWGGPDSEGNYYGSVAFELDLSKIDGPGKRSIATETGYRTASQASQGAIPDSVEAIYAPRLILEHFKKGIKRSYFYELIDDPSNVQPGYGLLKYDLTPKPAFTAIKNLLGILADSNTPFTPADLDYSLTGSTQGVETLLVQKSQGGVYWLAVWLSGSIYDVNALQATPIPPQTVTLILPGGKTANYVGKFDATGQTVSSWPNRSTYTFQATSGVTMIRIK